MTEDTQDQPVRIVTGQKTRDTTNDRFVFQLGDDDTVLVALRPPLAVMLTMIESLTDETNVLAQAASFNRLITEVFPDESEAYLRGRLEDRDDELDLDHPLFVEMFQTFVAIWYPGAGPTGGRRGSSASSARTGKRSTARSRSGASTQ